MSIPFPPPPPPRYPPPSRFLPITLGTTRRTHSFATTNLGGSSTHSTSTETGAKNIVPTPNHTPKMSILQNFAYIGLLCMTILNTYFIRTFFLATTNWELIRIEAAEEESVGRGTKAIARTNLLFIMFDDLRPELSIYGKYHMITPNFARLAAKSVVFDHAYAQISVCNPSRDSLLTGLRPDTVGTYGFQSSYSTYQKHMIIPTKLKRAGFRTVGLGKTRHWDGQDPEIWDRGWDNKWYDYQALEWDFMNSSVMPDKRWPEERFPDHQFATRAIEELKLLTSTQEQDKYFMLSVGFKMPHTAMHVPYKYFDMYRSRSHEFEATPDQLRFPPTSPMISWRCCAEHDYRYMNNEGARKANVTHMIQAVNNSFPAAVRKEMTWGYASLITFVDKQLGRLLDCIDELKLWNNLTIILTADHGMHNGEKGTWEKWSLFDESTHVPLIIHHPQSPFKGQRYPYPVELIDIFPTVNDILGVKFNRKELYGNDPKEPDYRKFIPLQGKSLAPVVMGREFKFRTKRSTNFVQYRGDLMPYLNRTFAMSQTWRCAPLHEHMKDPRKKEWAGMVPTDFKPWDCCNVDDKQQDIDRQLSVMGYAMRTPDYRYVGYIHSLRPHRLPMFDKPLYAEELYDHRGDLESDLGKKELQNLAVDPAYREVLLQHRKQLLSFLYQEVVYVNISSTFLDKEKASLWSLGGLKGSKKRKGGWGGIFGQATV